MLPRARSLTSLLAALARRNAYRCSESGSQRCYRYHSFHQVFVFIVAETLTTAATHQEVQAALRKRLRDEMPSELSDDSKTELKSKLDRMVAEEVEEAEYTMSWTRNRIGWFPFSREDSIEHVFDTRGRMQ